MDGIGVDENKKILGNEKWEIFMQSNKINFGQHSLLLFSLFAC